MKKIPIAIIGAQWGDEGKGKIVDFLSKEADFVVRFNGGNNAGHTIVYKDKRFPLSHMPSGILWNKQLLISQGCVINPKVLLAEIDFFKVQGSKIRLSVDPRVNIVMPYHQALDAATEEAKGDKKVGSLKLGIGYCYEDRNNRHGIRLEDLINPDIFKSKLSEELELKSKRLKGVYNTDINLSFEQIYLEYVNYGEKLMPYMADVSNIVHKFINKKMIIFEGAHGTFLDANFGTYPYTTAVNTISGAIFPYVGIPPQKINVLGIVKAYTTRVGGGPFPSELSDGDGAKLQEKGLEIGTVSKRRRRCGWLDLPMLRFANRLNGFDSLAITKLDVLSSFDTVKITDHYLINGKKVTEFPSELSDVEKAKPIFKSFQGWKTQIVNCKKLRHLPVNCRKYLQHIEKELKVPIKYISVGAERNEMIKI